ncbi:MAG TPA: chemotaxis protein CheX [Spirochaetia bacterium]|nr:chemotaxis protein CheX [Spirochaetia bacterium]
MKAEYANVFVRGATTVFTQEVGVNLSRTGLTRKNAPVPNLPISIVIGITGGIRGQVVYSMDQTFAYAVTKAMIPNKLPSELKKLTNSAVSEIANMITGQASIALAGENDLIHLTPPAVFSGSDMTVDFLSIPTICLSFISEIGSMEINIAFTEGGGAR